MIGTRRGSVLVGTSGWQYPDWRASFYPPQLPVPAWLGHYAGRLPAVEVNSSFYQLPSPATLEQWASQTPPGFRFAVKAPRAITHLRKLRSAGAALANLLARVRSLDERRGPILFQLPPGWGCNLQRLSEFLRELPRDLRYAFELRDPSWHVPQTYELLQAHDAAFCIFDLAGRASPLVVTTDLVYARLHGPTALAHSGSYADGTLRTWAARARTWAEREGREVWIFFDNDQAGHAPRNAARLIDHLGEDLSALHTPGREPATD